MSILTGQNALASDFINQSQKNATPSNDQNRVPKLESDGKLSGFFTKNGQILNAGATINGATLPVPVYQNKTDNEVYACDANDTAAMKFIGFAISNSTDGNPINVQFSGVVGGFSGLDEGQKYYVSDSVGTISSTPGTREILVGVAISQTEIFIQKGTRRMNGTLSLSDGGADESTQNTAITLGFRPSVIRMSAYFDDDAGSFSASQGTWVNGVYACIYNVVESTSQTVGATSSHIINIYGNGVSTEQWQLTITSVTDTGFTIAALQKDASPLPIVCIWEAEGEL